MRFQNLENSKIYRLYREDEMDRLKRKIQEIKKRKNQHLTVEGRLLPCISGGFGFSLERKHQIDKENKRLQQKISKAKNTHSNYYFSKIDLKKSSTAKTHTSRIVETLTNRSAERSRSPLPEAKTERSPFKLANIVNKKVSEPQPIKQKTQENESGQPLSFRKQIMRIYNESFTNFRKLPF